MRVITSVVMVVCAAGLAGAGETPVCPPPKPLGCEKLLTLAEKRCTDTRLDQFCDLYTPPGQVQVPCPQCQQVKCPECADVPPTVIKEFVDVPVYVPAVERGQWYIGGGLSVLTTGGFGATWEDEHRIHSLTAERGNQLGVTVQGGYKFPRGVMLLGSVTKYGGSGGNVALYDSRGRTDGEWIVGDGGGGKVSVGATVLVPIGGRK